jgi:DNA primase
MTGKVLGFGGRTVVNSDPKYLNSPDTPVYTKGQQLYGLNASKEAIRQAGEAILVEGYTDYLSVAQAGHRNVVASLGTALTPQQIGLAMRFAPRLIINYDGDDAGQKAAFRALPLCWEKGVETRVVVLPDNLDPDGFLKKHGAEAYAGRLRDAAPGLRFFLEYATRGQRLNVPEVKTRILRGILSVLDNVPDAVLRSEYLKETAETLGIDESVLRRLSQPQVSPGAASQAAGLFPAERRLLQILMEGPEIRPDIFAEVEEDDFRGLKSEAVFKIILDRFSKDKEILLNDLQKEVDPALFRELSRTLLEKGEPPNVPEALDCLNALRKTSKESELKRIQTEIQRAERADEKGRLDELLRRKQDLTKQILSLP